MARRSSFFGGQFRGIPHGPRDDSYTEDPRDFRGDSYNYSQDVPNDRRPVDYDRNYLGRDRQDYERPLPRERHMPPPMREHQLMDFRERFRDEHDRNFPRERSFSDQSYLNRGPQNVLYRGPQQHPEPRRQGSGPPRFQGGPQGQHMKPQDNMVPYKGPIPNRPFNTQLKSELPQKRGTMLRDSREAKRQRTQSAEVTSTCTDEVLEKLHNPKFQDGSYLESIVVNKDVGLKTFILRALEKRMEDVWPQPKSLYYCRTCNYAEYNSQELLDRHLKSARHLEFQRHYNEAFCVDCQHHSGDLNGMEKHLQTQPHREIVQVVDITKSRAALYFKRKHGNINSNPASADSFKMTERLLEPKKIESQINQEKIKKEIVITPELESNVLKALSNINKNENETSISKNDNEKIIEKNEKETKINEKESKVTTSLIKKEEEKTEIKQKVPETKETFTGLKINKSLIEQNKALLKKVESISESLSSYCSKPSPLDVLLEKNELLGKTKPNDKKTASKSNTSREKTENQKIENENSEKQPNETNNDSIIKSPLKSRITAIVEKRRNDELEKEKEKEKEKLEKAKQKENKFDDFIVPLTGYMCTVCHQTLDDDEEAVKHMNGYQHRKNTEFHKSKYGSL